MIIYVWKMIYGMALMITELNGSPLEVDTSTRRGLLCRIPPRNYRAHARVWNGIERSLVVHASRLFNAIPRQLRETPSMESFKRELDRFLAAVPDKPSLPHYYQPTQNNSVLEQMRHMR